MGSAGVTVGGSYWKLLFNQIVESCDVSYGGRSLEQKLLNTRGSVSPGCWIVDEKYLDVTELSVGWDDSCGGTSVARYVIFESFQPACCGYYAAVKARSITKGK